MLNGVLLVDDDTTTNFLNKLLLLTTMRVTKEVLVAENGAEALRILQERCTPPDGPGCPELILLDMNMPIMNGLAFLEAYFTLPPERRQHTVVAMLTTSLNPLDQVRVEQLPITGFLNKPLTREKVTTLLAEHFAAK
ncbi:response regulator [Hymenobacter sp. HMF4947]|uniref:Response regulator n=1 Tax=Hymenobacter ginkgonis TaxID=2682976 RepID=A0A7K1TK78_9BACT|nr:response regulator [Hymenobacter ginkgonis]